MDSHHISYPLPFRDELIYFVEIYRYHYYHFVDIEILPDHSLRYVQMLSRQTLFLNQNLLPHYFYSTHQLMIGNHLGWLLL